MIDASNITKSFGTFKALDAAEIHVPKGSIYGLVGPNGAGKTTLLRHLAGVMKADEGEITLGDEPLYENEHAKARMAFVSDDVFYFRQSTIESLMKFYRDIYPTFDEEYFHAVLGCFSELQNKRQLRRMSKGMQKQAAVVLNLSIRPDLLILDEPMDGLDPVMRRQVWNLILQEVSERDMTVLVSSHNLRELEDVCDYVGIMHKGKVVLEHSLSELQDDIHKVQAAFEKDAPVLQSKDGVTVYYHSSLGKVNTWIIRGKREQISKLLKDSHPMFVDLLPLTLEEIFIYELGGEDYAVKEILV